MLKLVGLNKFYYLGDNSFHALKDINIHFKMGEIVSILGESGSGKSTMLNLIGGLDIFQEGDLLISDLSTKKFNRSEWDAYRNNHIGFIFQSYNLIPHLTALENVEIALTLSNVSKAERIKKAEEALIRVGLKDQLHKKPAYMSGGQKQRVAIARAIVNDPDILLCDEPTGALDSKTSQEVMDLIVEVGKGKLIIMVTHSPEIAKAYSTRIISLADGEVVNDTAKDDKEDLKASSDELKVKNTSMGFSSALKISYKNLWQKKWRTLFTSLGIAIGLSFILVILSLGNGVSTMTDKMLRSSMPVDQIKVYTSESSILLTEDYVDQIAELPNIHHIIKQYELDLYIELNGTEAIYSNIYTLSEDKFETNIQLHERGSYPTTNNSVVVDSVYLIHYYKARYGMSLQQVQDLISTRKLSYDDIWNDVSGDQLQLKIVLNPGQTNEYEETFQIVGYHPGGSVNENKPGIYMLEEPIVSLARIDYGLSDEELPFIDVLDVYVTDFSGENLKTTMDNIENISNLVTSSVYLSQIDEVNRLLQIVQVVLIGMASISLITAAIMIGIVIYISVLERTNEIGVLRALGARKKDIQRIFMAETIIIGFVGGCISIFAAFILNIFGNIIAKKMIASSTEGIFDYDVLVMPLYAIAVGLIIGIIVAMIGGLIPSNKGAKVNPVEALRHE